MPLLKLFDYSDNCSMVFRKKTSFLLMFALFSISQFFAIDKCIPSPGVYENSNKFIIISDENEPDKGVYKLFYSFYYDGEYAFEEDKEPFCVVEIDNKLYTDFWIRYDTVIKSDLGTDTDTKCVFWLPAGNMKEISLNPPYRKESLYGYFVIYGKNSEVSEVLRIHYWLTDTEYSDIQVVIPLDDEKSVAIPEFTKIGSYTYKCINGRKPVVRHAEKVAGLPDDAVFAADGDVMASGKYFTKISDSLTLISEIQAHNSIVYPPRFSVLEIREPSIYKKLEEMSLKEEFEKFPSK